MISNSALPQRVELYHSDREKFFVPPVASIPPFDPELFLDREEVELVEQIAKRVVSDSCGEVVLYGGRVWPAVFYKLLEHGGSGAPIWQWMTPQDSADVDIAFVSDKYNFNRFSDWIYEVAEQRNLRALKEGNKVLLYNPFSARNVSFILDITHFPSEDAFPGRYCPDYLRGISVQLCEQGWVANIPVAKRPLTRLSQLLEVPNPEAVLAQPLGSVLSAAMKVLADCETLCYYPETISSVFRFITKVKIRLSEHRTKVWDYKQVLIFLSLYYSQTQLHGCNDGSNSFARSCHRLLGLEAELVQEGLEAVDSWCQRYLRGYEPMSQFFDPEATRPEVMPDGKLFCYRFDMDTVRAAKDALVTA